MRCKRQRIASTVCTSDNQKACVTSTGKGNDGVCKPRRTARETSDSAGWFWGVFPRAASPIKSPCPIGHPPFQGGLGRTMFAPTVGGKLPVLFGAGRCGHRPLRDSPVTYGDIPLFKGDSGERCSPLRWGCFSVWLKSRESYDGDGLSFGKGQREIVSNQVEIVLEIFLWI